MEIILKKTKITSSIFNQIQNANVADLIPSNVMGYCIQKNQRCILFYNQETNELRKWTMPVSWGRYDDNDKKYVKIFYGSHYVSLHYPVKDEEEGLSFMELIKEIKETSISKGQFYL